jgi:hypothetical protein
VNVSHSLSVSKFRPPKMCFVTAFTLAYPMSGSVNSLVLVIRITRVSGNYCSELAIVSERLSNNCTTP